MDLPALTSLVEYLRKAGVRRYRQGDVEIEFAPVAVATDLLERAARASLAAEPEKPVFAGKTKAQLEAALPGWSKAHGQ